MWSRSAAGDGAGAPSAKDGTPSNEDKSSPDSSGDAGRSDEADHQAPSWSSPPTSAWRPKYNEPKYRSLFTAVLKRHSGCFAGDAGGDGDDPSPYEAEASLLRNAVASERDAWLLGLVAGASTFVAVRYGPSILVRRFGSPDKVEALISSEAATKGDRSAMEFLRRGVRLTLEALLGGWAGVKGHAVASRYTTNRGDVYEEISKIPLVPGRSRIAHAVCDEWIDAYRKMPKEFWREGEEEHWRDDPKTWKSIRTFALNCMKRKEYAKQLRLQENEGRINTVPLGAEEEGGNDEQPIMIPAPGVPMDVAIEEYEDSDVDGMRLTRKEAESMVLDTKS